MTKSADTMAYPLGPALEFLRKLWELNHSLEKVSRHTAARIGVTAEQRLVIRCLGRYPGIPAGTLAMLLHLDPGSISAALRRLEEKGLIERRRDPRDGRRVSLGLTAKGRGLDRSTPGTVENAVERLLDRTPGADVEATARVLAELTSLLRHEVTD